MQIKVGSTSNSAVRVALLGGILFLIIGFLGLEIRIVLDNSHEALLHSSMSNMTSIKIGIFCGIPYDDCRCSVQSTKNIHLEYCLTDNFLMISRLHPLVSFVFQIFLIRDLFTFSGKHIRFVVYVLWAISLFIFFIIADGIYRNSCFHRYISLFLHGTGGGLFMFVLYDILYRKDIHRSSHKDCDTSSHNDCDTSSQNDYDTSFHNDYDTSSDETLEEVNNETICWRNLI
jgi:hypothetical protein